MKWSRSFLHTQKDAPNDAEIPSHRLMIRAGLIRKVAPGVFTYGNFAVRALRKFESIIREELNRRGAQEILMPMVQPAQLWQETGRWQQMGEALLKFRNRNDQEFCLGATHEEVVTDYIRRDLKSYRELPMTFYQIQTKYRDEVRPRFGLIRGREFIMKDAYSFDLTRESALENYRLMYEAYESIFKRVGARFRIVEADAGTIGGSHTHEFQLLANSGEDHLMVCQRCDFASNIEVAPAPVRHRTATASGSSPDSSESEPSLTHATSSSRNSGENIPAFEAFPTPGLKTISELARSLGVAEAALVKTLFYMVSLHERERPVCVLVRGSDELNPIKLKNFLSASTEPRLLTDVEVRAVCGAAPGSCGPVGLDIPIYLDEALASTPEFTVGANRDDQHLHHVVPGRDFLVTASGDLRRAQEGEPCPRCVDGTYHSIRGIEVGHVFYLGTKYSKQMQAQYLTSAGDLKPVEMGCYGIGVSRTIQAVIEQSHDQDGIIWPIAIAPFDVHIVVLDPENVEVLQSAEIIYRDLQMHGLDVFMDDRIERPGIKFKDADLLGLPIRVNIGARGLKNDEVEVITRHNKDMHKIKIDLCVERVGELAHELNNANR